MKRQSNTKMGKRIDLFFKEDIEMHKNPIIREMFNITIIRKVQTKKLQDIISHPLELLEEKQQAMTNLGKNQEKREPSKPAEENGMLLPPKKKVC